jgi:protein involved in sex pheromone biosynthesis
MSDNETKRLTIDIPLEIFCQAKAIAAIYNLSLKKLITRWMVEKIVEVEKYGIKK